MSIKDRLSFQMIGTRFLLILLLLIGSRVSAVSAQEQPEVAVVSEASYEFGQVIHFSLSGNVDAPVERATLFMTAPELPNTFTVDLKVGLADEELRLEYEVDLNQFQLAPFTTVTYWWELIISGNQVTIPEQRLAYDDDRFQWQQAERDGVVVFWTGDEANLGQLGLDAAGDALPVIQSIIPVIVEGPLRIYIYPSAGDLQAALRLTGRNWVGAHARPELGVILVSAGNSRTAEVDLRQSIPHELSHLFLYKAAGVSYETVPLWLDEGLASYFETSPNPDYALILEQAVAAEETVPLSELCASLPADASRAALAYAQSHSLIVFLQAQYGNQGLREMVRVAADGADCQSIPRRTFDMSLDELDDAWLKDLSPDSGVGRFVGQNAIWLLLLLAGFGLMSFFLLHPTGEGRRERPGKERQA